MTNDLRAKNSGKVGNKGNTTLSADRAKVAKFKGYVLDYLIAVMEGEDDKLKKEVVLKLGNNVIPKEDSMEHSGGISINLINYEDSNSTDDNTTSIPVGNSSESNEG